jgi:predicted pyridoxine 5'-phosphate oxidase superfamily flavin-nucleotide-binding protein
MFDADIPVAFGRFIAAQQLAAVAARDTGGAMWSTVLTGEPGAFVVPDERTVSLPMPGPGDPLADAFESPADVGIVVMAPQAARRVRVNGTGRRVGDRLVVTTEQVLGNCPKYLQIREVTGVDGDTPRGAPVRSVGLTGPQSDWVAAADTFFVGSAASGHGADASHRGGMPGFVTATGPGRLSWPDYFGNSFYMTLGNVELDPRAGLVFVDWDTGSTLQLTGVCTVDWSRDRTAQHPGALKIVDFHIEQAVQIDHASPLRWTLRGYSRTNPGVKR